jgi:hypothetical protein
MPHVVRFDQRRILRGKGKELAKPFIEPILVAPSSVIAIAPFRYLWNNPPGFVGQNLWLALLTPLAVYFVTALGLSYLMTLCLSRWKS